MNLDCDIAALARYALDKGLIEPCETDYSINRILALFRRDSFEPRALLVRTPDRPLEAILKALLDTAAQQKLLPDNSTLWRDLFDTALMDCIAPRPGQVVRRFNRLYGQDPKAATDDFYRFCQDIDYIRTYRICKDLRWTVDSAYGQIELSINLSKPEKDPKAIAAAAKSSGAYPQCQLCVQNVGYAGRADHPARQTLRTIPVTVCAQPWALQFSPYVYYEQHCIVLNTQHVPMAISRETFEKLLDFVRQFPHYFLGSNADLPIVGGSILSHDHYQGGLHDFPMAKAPVDCWRSVPGFGSVQMGVVHWPMTVLRLKGAQAADLCGLAEHILTCWRAYSDPQADVIAFTGDTPHHTITPIARKNGQDYELDLVLRDNHTSQAHPLGVYHPHSDKHHIKKENIGLIEVMGLAVLPARLKGELEAVADALFEGRAMESLETQKHALWAQSMKNRVQGLARSEVFSMLLKETGKVFVSVLEDAGVYKRTKQGQAALACFLAQL